MRTKYIDEQHTLSCLYGTPGSYESRTSNEYVHVICISFPQLVQRPGLSPLFMTSTNPASQVLLDMLCRPLQTSHSDTLLPSFSLRQKCTVTECAKQLAHSITTQKHPTRHSNNFRARTQRSVFRSYPVATLYYTNTPSSDTSANEDNSFRNHIR
jgi:hypothetical protein